VTDYLIAVSPASYQITSPRNNEPDTLKELVVTDPLSTLLNEILQLKESSVLPDEITVLVPTDLVKNSLQNDMRTLGVNIETVSRFRGMESSVVITLYSESMEDAQLFCAYSRATTAFIAIYDSEKLAWREKINFCINWLTERRFREQLMKQSIILPPVFLWPVFSAKES
ncbi:TPA: hypothetical protein ACHJWD_005329, partial [Escherichia coli]